MGLNVSQLGVDILASFKHTLTDKCPEIRDYAEAEAKKLAHTLVMIEALIVSGKINHEQAMLHIEIQKNAIRTVLLATEGLGILAVEAAINKALDVVKNTVNSAIGFALL